VTSSSTWPLDSTFSITIGDPLDQSLYLQPFSRYWPVRALGRGQDLDISGSRDVIGHVTIRFVPRGPRHSIVTKSLSWAIFEIMGTKHIGVMTFTFQGHLTSSVTWPLDSRWSISYWWSVGPKSLSLTISEIFRPKHHVLIDSMLNRHCACAYHVTCTPYVEFKYIFQCLAPTLPIHDATFIGLRWRIRGVLSVTSNVKGQIEWKISKSKNLQNFDLLGGLEIRGYEKLRFLLQKYHPCVNARRLSYFVSKSVEGSDLQRWAGKKTQTVTRGSHRNDVSPLTQGLRYRAACDEEIRSNVIIKQSTRCKHAQKVTKMQIVTFAFCTV